MVNLKKALAFSLLFGIILLDARRDNMAKVGNRQRKTLVCTVCGNKDTRTERNVKNTTERLELNRYCAKCQKHTAHKEEK